MDKEEQKTSVKGKAIANWLTDSANFADFFPSFFKQFLRRVYLKSFNMYCLCESLYENVGQHVIASADCDVWKIKLDWRKGHERQAMLVLEHEGGIDFFKCIRL